MIALMALLAAQDVEVYKKAGDVELKMWIHAPLGHRASDKRPVVVFFFGGGWNSGTPTQFEPQCRYLASRGMVAATADYRVKSRHGTKAVACVADGKSAVRWLRANAARLGIDPARIAAGGGSAGGHVAACTALIEGFEEAGEDVAVSSVPNALVLFNPAVALDDALVERLGVEPASKLSPFHNVRKGAPPTLVLNGKEDTTTTYADAERFRDAMTKAGNRCELEGYEGVGHGFFNFARKTPDRRYAETVRRMDVFLASLGWLSGDPTLKE
jgi:acetyl esterase/lipase